jgi:hypothetical protein
MAVAMVSLIVAEPQRALSQPAEAETLFHEGRRLMSEGKIAEACESFEVSNRIDLAVSTLLNLADCREKNGQPATAWAVFLKAASAARSLGNKTLETVANTRATRLEARLSYLTISVPDSSKVEGLEIMRNGLLVDPTLWNTGVPIDPGAYEISARAPGREPWSRRIVVEGEAQRPSVEVPRFKELPRPSIEPVAREPVDAPTSPSRWTRMRKASLGVAAGGAFSVGGGVLFGMRARTAEREADERCPIAACTDPEAIAANERAKTNAFRANVLFGVGGAAIAGAALLWLLGAPERDASPFAASPVADGDGLVLMLGGRF